MHLPGGGRERESLGFKIWHRNQKQSEETLDLKKKCLGFGQYLKRWTHLVLAAELSSEGTKF